jgi:hypothetical protein
MPASQPMPFPPDQVADARRLVANLHLFLHLPAEELSQMRHTAWTILRVDQIVRRRMANQAATRAALPEDAA